MFLSQIALSDQQAGGGRVSRSRQTPFITNTTLKMGTPNVPSVPNTAAGRQIAAAWFEPRKRKLKWLQRAIGFAIGVGVGQRTGLPGVLIFRKRGVVGKVLPELAAGARVGLLAEVAAQSYLNARAARRAAAAGPGTSPVWRAVGEQLHNISVGGSTPGAGTGFDWAPYMGP